MMPLSRMTFLLEVLTGRRPSEATLLTGMAKIVRALNSDDS
jgi:hypothetical protein